MFVLLTGSKIQHDVTLYIPKAPEHTCFRALCKCHSLQERKLCVCFVCECALSTEKNATVKPFILVRPVMPMVTAYWRS